MTAHELYDRILKIYLRRPTATTATTNPVTVDLTIWDDAGTTTVTRAFADPRWLGSWQPEAFMEERPSTGMSV
jgi:hypothetical protein